MKEEKEEPLELKSIIMRRAMGLVPSLLFFRLIEQKNKTQEHKNKRC